MKSNLRFTIFDLRFCCFVVFFFCFIPNFSFAQKPQPVKHTSAVKDSLNLISTVLANHPEWFGEVISNQKKYQPQIIFTAITRDEKGVAHFETYRYHADEYYFYAASWMKLPLSVFTLEKLNQLHLSKENMLNVQPKKGYSDDEWSEASKISPSTFSQIIKEAMVVSNNASYNLLFDFLGVDSINHRFRSLKYKKAVVCNRFSGCDSFGHKCCNPLTVADFKTNKIVYSQNFCSIPTQYRSTFRNPYFGMYHYEKGILKPGVKNFSHHNYIPLTEMHRFITQLYFPAETKSKLNLTDDDYSFLKNAMSLLPRNSTNPIYDETDYPDGFMKPLFIGDTKNRMPDNLKIYNKVGQYFGWTCDNAYVSDSTNHIEFIISVVLFTNQKNIVWDDQAAYDHIAIPFIANIGKAFYEEELKRKK